MTPDDHTYDAVPDELKALNQWVLWRYETREKKPTKVPYCARTMARASSTNPATWASFDDALRKRALRNQGAGRDVFGLGFVFSPDDPYCGIDIDGCLEDNGENLTELGLSILNTFARPSPGGNAYIESSPSRTGIHIICRAEWPGVSGMNNRRVGIEAYNQGRYFTVTGDALDNSLDPQAPLPDVQDVIDALYVRYALEPTASPVQPADGDPEARDGQPQTWKDLRLDIDPSAEPPGTKLMALNAKKGFKETWEHKRDTKGWENASQSGYDFAIGRYAQEAGWSDQEICNLLIAHRRHHDAGRLDRLDYYQRTIFKLRQTARYEAAQNDLDDADSMTPEDKPAIKQLILTLTGLKLERYVQVGRSPASYMVQLAPHNGEDRGETVVIASSADARSQNAWQDIAQETLGAPFQAMKPAKWHQFLKCLAVLREYEEAVEASHTEELVDLLRLYGRVAIKLPPGEHPTAEDIRAQTAIRLGDDLLFSLADFKSWFAAHSAGAPYKGVMGRLRAAGVSRDTLYSADDQGQARRRYWRVTLPD